MNEPLNIEDDDKIVPQVIAMGERGDLSSCGGRYRSRALSILAASVCLMAIETHLPQRYAADILSSVQAAGLTAQSSGAVLVPSAKPQEDPAAIYPPVNVDLFLKHASDAGATACAGVYASLGKALTNGNPFMVQTQSAKENANAHSLQGVVGMSYQSDAGNAGPAAGLVFAAPVGTSCEGHMVRVVPVAKNCQETAALLPKGSSPLQPLNGIPVYSLSAGGQAMLIPASAGCVAISIVRSGG